MFFTQSESLSEHIIRALTASPLSAKEISLLTTKDAYSIQGIYKALRMLLRDKIILKTRNIYSINNEWLEKINSTFRVKKLGLMDGDKTTYQFSSMTQVDQFWRNLIKKIPSADRLIAPYFYLPHDFWVYLPDRKNNVDLYYDNLYSLQHKAYLTIGGSSSADILLKKKLRNRHLKVNTLQKGFFKRSEHIAIFGGYIITTKISTSLSREIDNLYSDQNIDMVTFETLIKSILIKNKKVIKIILEKNNIKSKVYIKKLSKDF